jgi:hypothetical protein
MLWKKLKWTELLDNVAKKLRGLHINGLTGEWRTEFNFQSLIIALGLATVPGNFVLLIDCDECSGKLSYF